MAPLARRVLPSRVSGARRVGLGCGGGLAGLAILVCGCGDALLGRDFRGPALASFRCDLEVAGALPSEVTPRIALFFSPQGPQITDVNALRELAASARDTVLPATLTVPVFETPPPSLMVQPPVQPAGYALGRLMVYGDSNRNGQRDPGDALLGIDPALAILWLPQPLAAGATPTSGALPAGFSSIMLPQRCGRPLPPPTTADACGVPLGEGCRTDADCGPGYCLRETKFPWPAGYCAVVEPPANGCRPGAASYYFAPSYAPIPPGIAGYYLRSCRQDRDCARTTDRDQFNYVCDPGLLACVPRLNSKIPIGGRFEVEPFCPRR